MMISTIGADVFTPSVLRAARANAMVDDESGRFNTGDSTGAAPQANRLRAHKSDHNETSRLQCMRGLLVVNPNATTTTHAPVRSSSIRCPTSSTLRRSRPIIAVTRPNGARARADGVDAVIALGGDGTANEIVNGMLGDQGPGPDVPAFGIVPGGSERVFPIDRIPAGPD